MKQNVFTQCRCWFIDYFGFFDPMPGGLPDFKFCSISTMLKCSLIEDPGIRRDGSAVTTAAQFHTWSLATLPPCFTLLTAHKQLTG